MATMRLSSITLLGVLVAAGCSADFEPDVPPSLVVPPDTATIAFTYQGTLPMAPGALVELEVRTDPPAQFDISFLLVGDALDASLDRPGALADASGRAVVTLKAPSTATSFVLRASIKGGGSADLPVAVSDKGFGSLVVVPKYGGTRPVETWHAGVISGKTCASLVGTLPQDPDGALTAQASKKDSPVIEIAPVGPTLAVYVRSGHYMWGCVDETDLKPDQVETVEVHVVNKPIDASAMLLATELAFAPEPMAFTTLLSNAASGLFSELGAGVPAATLLLQAMEQASSDPPAFAYAATQYDWATAIEAHFAQNEIDLVQALIAHGSDGLAGEPPLIVGRLEAIPNVPTHAQFEVEQIGSAGLGSATFATSNNFTLGVDPDDVVHLGGKLQFLPGRYVAHVIETEALAQSPQASSMADVLDALVMCDALYLSGMSDCEGDCIAQLCRDGLAIMWSDAMSAASAPKGEIVVQISGAAAFDDFAALTGFSGSWLGAVKYGGTEAKVSGPVQATPVSSGPG